MTEAAEPTIVYLDVDDEITSAAARLRRIEAEAIVFVLPYGSRLATSRINFRLLAREAANRGKHLEIVAADASARALAGTAGLAVHASVAAFEGREPGPGEAASAATASGAATSAATPPGAGAAQPAGGATEWPVAPVVPGPSGDGTETRVLAIPRSAEPVPVVGRRRAVIRPRTAIAIALALLLLVGGGGLAAFLYLPSATIVLHPASEAVGPLSLSVEARTDAASADPSSLVVPAQQFAFDLSASQTFTTTGKQVAETKASGNVTFQNCNTGAKVTIPAGSRVATQSGIGFVTLARVSIRRAQVFPFTCFTGSTAVEAEQPGLSGNVAAGAISQIPPGYDRLVLSVTNTQPTSGGTHDETPQVSQQDVDAALATLTQALGEDLDAKITEATGVPAGTTLLESTGKVGTVTPSVDPKTLLGQAIASFDLGATATGTAVGVDTAPVQALAAQRLAGSVSPGWQLVDGSTSIEVGRPTVSGDGISFPVTAAARQVRLIDRDALLARIMGLDLPHARVVLQDYGEVDIRLWPDWVTTIPGDPNRISLTIDAGAVPTGTAGPGTPGPTSR